ncbi:hypothetical protein BRADI_4g39945v3 [Brachypodium distachyon]|uniref:Uncharacterized protein n=1 Tax=Brachypodium distachyon TaxID=15368 RepID=A0A0Q3HU31_BRADI|nr:hypothetical protein BRADI_4g39945v3 [Brachypodium distachyon]
MSGPDVMYRSCRFPLNLSSSTGTMSTEASSKHQAKSVKKGVISFASVDLSRFTQVDEVSCFSLAWGRRRGPKFKLLCRKCGAPVGYGYGEPAAVLCSSSSSASEEYLMKIEALQPSSEGAP